jgi:hypothetical protein
MSSPNPTAPLAPGKTVSAAAFSLMNNLISFYLGEGRDKQGRLLAERR